MRWELLAIGMALLLLAACGKPAADAAPAAPAAAPSTAAPPGATTADSLAAFFAKGTGVECSYDAGGDHRVVQFFGKDAHVTTTGPDAGEIYVTAQGVFSKSTQPGCDWISLPTDESSLPTLDKDWTLADMEHAYGAMYTNVHCAKKAFADADFTPKGKTCDLTSLMQQQMG